MPRRGPGESYGARLVETVGMGLASEQPGGAASRDGVPLESCPARCVVPAFETSRARGLFWRLARAEPIAPTWSRSPSPKRRLTPLPARAEVFKRDIANATVRFFDTRHFALETHAPEVAAAIRGFLP
jgi:hypothetical protein